MTLSCWHSLTVYFLGVDVDGLFLMDVDGFFKLSVILINIVHISSTCGFFNSFRLIRIKF